MAIQFPNNPNILDTVVQAGITYQWNGASWEVIPEPISYDDISGDSITLGDSTISHVNNEGLHIDSDGLYISGSIFNNLSHNGNIIPNELTNLPDVVEYLAFNQSIMNNETESVLSFGEGISGLNHSLEYRLHVASRSGGIASSPDSDNIYDPNTTANIQANPLNGYSFDRWESDADIADATSANTTINMTEDKYVVAYFKKD
jgi:hypothetical protein